uniref:PDZ domain-containing protein n=1 Tax=Noctiluca scintillans TaxID=2966 RepID=A0A7S1FI95_NOCSC
MGSTASCRTPCCARALHGDGKEVIPRDFGEPEHDDDIFAGQLPKVIAASASRPEDLQQIDQQTAGDRIVEDGFLVTLDRTNGAKLGIEVDKLDGTALLVAVIEEAGLVPDWNASAHANFAVSTGQIITEVNGVRGSASLLLKECKQYQELNLWILRSSPAAS